MRRESLCCCPERLPSPGLTGRDSGWRRELQTQQAWLVQHGIPWELLGIAGRLQPHRQQSLHGQTHVLGKTSAKGLLAGGCVSKARVLQEISPCQGQVKANKPSSATSPGGRGGSLCDTSASPHIPLHTQHRNRAKAKLRSNKKPCRPAEWP